MTHNIKIPSGWRLFGPGEAKKDGDRFCDPRDSCEDPTWHVIEGVTYASEQQFAEGLVYIKPVEIPRQTEAELLGNRPMMSDEARLLWALRDATEKIERLIKQLKRGGT